MDRGAAVGLVVGGVVGGAVGVLIEVIAGPTMLLPAGGLTIGAAAVGASWGALLGSVIGLGAPAGPDRAAQADTNAVPHGSLGHQH